MGDLVAFRRFVMSLRRERERQGLSLADVAERAKIDKGSIEPAGKWPATQPDGEHSRKVRAGDRQELELGNDQCA